MIVMMDIFIYIYILTNEANPHNSNNKLNFDN